MYRVLFITTGLQYTADRAERDEQMPKKPLGIYSFNIRLQHISQSPKLTGDVMIRPEDHLHMIPYVQGAEP